MVGFLLLKHFFLEMIFLELSINTRNDHLQIEASKWVSKHVFLKFLKPPTYFRFPGNITRHFGVKYTFYSSKYKSENSKN